MHDDDYYYEERQKSRGKSERMLIGSIASILRCCDGKRLW